jgi:hypothetical protein
MGHATFRILEQLPSGKRLHNYGKSPCSMGKSTILTGPFSIENCERLPEGIEYRLHLGTTSMEQLHG